MDSSKIFSLVQRIKDLASSQGLSKSEIIQVAEKLKHAHTCCDTAYLLCVFFPEFSSPARLPTKFTQPTALFTHRFSYYLSTGVDGSGAMCLLPFDMTSYCSWNTDPTAPYGGNTSNNIIPAQFQSASATFQYPVNFDKVRLLAASLRMQYIGNVEQEAGFLQGSFVLESKIGQFSDDIINDGFFVTRCRPREGIRLNWLPKEEDDNDFYGTDQQVFMDVGVFANNVVTTNYLTGVSPADANFNVEDYKDNGTFSAQLIGANYAKQPSFFLGMGKQSAQNNTPEQMMISWTGLVPNQMWFRVDVERHFEGTPRHIIRDIVSTARGSPSEKTLDVVRKFAEMSEIQSHTMEQLPSLYQRIKAKVADADTWVQQVSEYNQMNGSSDAPMTFINNSENDTPIAPWLDYASPANSTAGSSLYAGRMGGDQFTQPIGQGYQMYVPNR